MTGFGPHLDFIGLPGYVAQVFQPLSRFVGAGSTEFLVDDAV